MSIPTHAKRVSYEETGDSSVLQYKDFEIPSPQKGQILVKVHAVGVNFIDIYFRSGLYKAPKLPAGAGSEGAGEVIQVGEGVTDFKIGDRVAYVGSVTGSYAEYTVVPQESTVPLPETVSYEAGAALALKGLTVEYLFRRTYKLQGGETILFHAAAGGVGLIANQWAKALGVKLIGTTSTKEKAELAKSFGAWEIIDYTKEDVAKRVLELTDGKKVPVVYDSVGKSTWEASLDSVAPLGTIVSFGNASGPVENVSLGILTQKGGLYVTRPSLYSHSATLKEAAKELFGLVAEGKIKANINLRARISDAAAVHDKLASRATTGSAVLYPDEFYKES